MKEEVTEGNYEDLIKYRLARAHETIAEIPYLSEQGYYNTASNRLYYACYYAALALLLKHHISSSSHAGTKAMLGLHFVSKGLISKESGRAYSNLFDSRQHSDYDEFFYSTKRDIEELLPKAQKFIEEVDFLLSDK